MSTPPPPPAEKVTIDGKTYNLRPCTRCTGTVMIYLIDKEPDRSKPPIWEVHNKDGSAHEHNTKRTGGGGGFRPPAPKFVLRIKKMTPASEVEMTAEFTSYDELNAKFAEWTKKEAIP